MEKRKIVSGYEGGLQRERLNGIVVQAWHKNHDFNLKINFCVCYGLEMKLKKKLSNPLACGVISLGDEITGA